MGYNINVYADQHMARNDTDPGVPASCEWKTITWACWENRELLDLD